MGLRKSLVMGTKSAGLVLSGTQYSNRFSVGNADNFSSHFVWDETSATLAVTITLWASNLDNPDQSTDTDWVQMVSGHNYNGLPGGNPASGDGKDIVEISNAGSYWFKWKTVLATGAGTLQIAVTAKDKS